MKLAPRICETCTRKCAGQKTIGKMCIDCIQSGHKVKTHWKGNSKNAS